MMQVQARLQRKTKEEKKSEEVMARHVEDKRVLEEQLKRSKRQMQAAQQMIKDKDEQMAKQQSAIKKYEERITRMKKVLAEKGLDTRDQLLREIDRQKRLTQEACEKAEVGPFAQANRSLRHSYKCTVAFVGGPTES